MGKRVAKRLNCPPCPECKSPSGITLGYHNGQPADLIDTAMGLLCAACGHHWHGTDAERARALAADLAQMATDFALEGKVKAQAKRAEAQAKLDRAREGRW
jgi:hypothetical protein